MTKTDVGRNYESIVIFNPQIDESSVKSDVDKLLALISNKGGRDVAADYWGKKQIAYLVNKQRYGNFVAISYQSDNHDIAKEVTDSLRIFESVIKFQTHRINSRKRKFKGNLRQVEKRKSRLEGSGDDSEEQDYE